MLLIDSFIISNQQYFLILPFSLFLSTSTLYKLLNPVLWHDSIFIIIYSNISSTTICTLSTLYIVHTDFNESCLIWISGINAFHPSMPRQQHLWKHTRSVFSTRTEWRRTFVYLQRDRNPFLYPFGSWTIQPIYPSTMGSLLNILIGVLTIASTPLRSNKSSQ